MAGDLLDVAGLAKAKGCGVATIYRAVRDGQIPFTRVGRQLVFREEDVAEWQPATYGDREGVKKPRGPGRPRREK